MAEQKIIIVKGGVDVLSELEREDLPDGRICIWVTSRVEGEVPVRGPMVIMPGTGYSREQFEFDVEDFRHKQADLAAGRGNVRSVVDASLIEPPAGDLPKVSAPRLPRPQPFTG